MKKGAVKKVCADCRFCEDWPKHMGCYCDNLDSELYLTDVDELKETCDKWEERS